MSFPSMKTVTRDEMRALDRRASEEFGIPSLLLMENAGRGVADLALSERFSENRSEGTIVVFCGKGNNGGDGLVAARHLYNRGFAMKVLLFAGPQTLKGDAAVNFQIISKMKIPCVILSEAKDLARFFAPNGAQNDILASSDLIIDALFGVGLHAPLEGMDAKAVDAINQSGRRVLAVDIPSGLDADTGEVRGVAVKASITATLGAVKQGLLRGAGPLHAGKICVVDISLPKELIS